MTEKYLSNRDATPSIGHSDFGTDGQVLRSSLDQICRPWRTIDVDRLDAILIPRDRHQRREPYRESGRSMGFGSIAAGGWACDHKVAVPTAQFVIRWGVGMV